MDLRGEPDGWSSIPEGILFLIACKIECIDDYVRLCAVCRSWHFLATDFYDNNLKQKLKRRPLLMSRPNRNSKRINIQDHGSGTTMVRHLTSTAGNQLWGSPFGWLISREPSRLVNPFTGATIPLPPLHGRCVINAFLTADPLSDPDRCLVFFLFESNKLAFVRRPARGTNYLSCIQGSFDLCDITYSKGNLYGLELSYNLRAKVVLFRLNRARQGRLVHRFVPFLDVNLRSYELNHDHPDDGLEQHLVDFNGELCLCVRHHRFSSTLSFKLYKIDVSTKKLTQVLSLGDDQCLFVASAKSFLCKATYPPTVSRRCESVSNYVFCTVELLKDWSRPPCEVEVWDMLNSRKVRSARSFSTPLYEPHWIAPSVIFRKLEDAPKSRATPTRKQSCRPKSISTRTAQQCGLQKLEDAPKSIPSTIATPTPEQSCYLQELEEAPKSIPTTSDQERLSCFRKLEDALESIPTSRGLMWVGNLVLLIFVLSYLR